QDRRERDRDEREAGGAGAGHESLQGWAVGRAACRLRARRRAANRAARPVASVGRLGHPCESRPARAPACRHLARSYYMSDSFERIARRTQLLGEAVIREMNDIAERHRAVNLAPGMPDFPAPEVLKEAACAAIRADLNQYAITDGAPALREVMADK